MKQQVLHAPSASPTNQRKLMEVPIAGLGPGCGEAHRLLQWQRRRRRTDQPTDVLLRWSAAPPRSLTTVPNSDCKSQWRRWYNRARVHKPCDGGGVAWVPKPAVFAFGARPFKSVCHVMVHQISTAVRV